MPPLFFYKVYCFITDALFGYPKERTWYPEGDEVRIRHKGGIWTLSPAATYCRRDFSPFKTDHRRGWIVADAPESMKRFVGTMNLTEEPGLAISNILKMEDYISETFPVMRA